MDFCHKFDHYISHFVISFKKERLLTIHNLYVYHCTLDIFKILKAQTPASTLSCFTVSQRKKALLLTPFPSIYFNYMAAKMWNTLQKQVLEDAQDFSLLTGAAKSNLKRYLLANQHEHDPEIWVSSNYSYI